MSGSTTGAPSRPAGMRPVSGWLTFAGLLIAVTGAFNVIDGLVALFRHNYYAVTDNGLLVFNFTTWGWIWLILGIVEILIGIGAIFGQLWARVVGVALAVVTAIGHLAFLAAFPVWSVIMIALCVMIIYGLCMPPRNAQGI